MVVEVLRIWRLHWSRNLVQELETEQYVKHNLGSGNIRLNHLNQAGLGAVRKFR